MSQLELHKRIDAILKAGPASADVNELATLFGNQDVKRYFYATADASWLPWLREKGLLEAVKQKSKSSGPGYSYRTSELDYLVRTAEKEPQGVVDFMCSFTISQENFNPEVVDRFLWIARGLPADQLKKIVPKMRDEEWPRLMGAYNQWGFAYDEMFKKLVAADDYETVVILAEAVLVIRSKEDADTTSFGSIRNAFYFRDVSQTEVFERLAGVPDNLLDAALAVARQTLKNLILLEGREAGEIFSLGESFSFWDVDFFTIEVGEKERLSSRDDARNLAAVVQTLLTRKLKPTCGNAEQARGVFDSFFNDMPDSRTMWRLQLYAISLCPEVFQADIRAALFRTFDYDKPGDLICVEYKELIKRRFGTLSLEDRHEYVRKLIDVCAEKKWPELGRELLSCAYEWLSEKEKERATKELGPLTEDYIPRPSGFYSRGGVVTHASPVEQDILAQKTVPEIVEKLKGEWAPEKFSSDFDDSNRIHDAEGLSNEIKRNISERFNEYVQNATLFFDRNALDPHYTHTFLNGVREYVKANRPSVQNVSLDELVKLFELIMASGKEEEFPLENNRERKGFAFWSASWVAVHDALAELIIALLEQENHIQALTDFPKYRDRLLPVIEYLLTNKNPRPEDEVCEKNDRGDFSCADPFTQAINSVRGRGFQALLMFMYRDGEKYPKDATVKIADEVKMAFETVLKKEDTRAILFLYGHYFSSLFYRDQKWAEEHLMPVMFSEDAARKDLYLAAWEGHLSTTLYREMFEKFPELYERGIRLKSEEYTPRKYYADIDEALATHIALAYMHFENVSLEHPLFVEFFATPNIKRHKDFISFLGRRAVANDDAKLWLETNKVPVEKLKAFWDWVLTQKIEPEALETFGFWINSKNGVFDVAWLAGQIRKTLEKSNGAIDFEYGLEHSLQALAEANPEETVKILRLYLLDGKELNAKNRNWIHMSGEMVQALTVLYGNEKTRGEAYQLIDDLLPLGNGAFWSLKSVIK